MLKHDTMKNGTSRTGLYEVPPRGNFKLKSLFNCIGANVVLGRH